MEEKFYSALAQLHTELTNTRNELKATEAAIRAIQSSSLTPKEPYLFSGKTSVRSWITHFNNYIGNEQTH